MTVCELIEELEKVPQDMRVVYIAEKGFKAEAVNVVVIADNHVVLM